MIVYKITNLVNGKIYVGQTIQTLSRRWSSHVFPGKHKLNAIDLAIKKYGRDSFSVHAIDSADTIEELNAKEIFWIAFYNSISPNGYNISSGGNNRLTNEETRRKISISNTGMAIGEKSARAKRVYQYSLSGEFIREYGSIREAARICGLQSTIISAVCRGKHFHHGGFRWTNTKGQIRQAPNKSFHLITHEGETKTIKEWADKLKIKYGTMFERVRRWESGGRYPFYSYKESGVTSE